MRKLRLTHFAVLGAVMVPLVVGAFVYQQRDTVASAQLLDEVLRITASRYVDSVPPSDLYEKAAKGLVKQLNDPYSVLWTKAEYDQFSQQTGGKYGGIGMEIAPTNGFVTVQRVFPHTPASAGGVMEGDRILKVDTANARGWTTAQVSDKLKGDPGTTVNVEFGRSGVSEPIPVKFTRAIVHIPAVPYTLVFGNIGYIPLQQFNETAAQEVADAVTDVTKHGATKIVFDMRGNPGGFLDQAIATSNLFLPVGKSILSVRGRTGEVQAYSATDAPEAPTIPMVVLVDPHTASASEIVAGALQDHDRALIMGTTSFGKGLVQSLYKLDGGYALKMTTAKWYTPSGRSIQVERKLLPDGELVEVMPDSLETDSARRARPKYKSDAGRIVYGGGGITPDIIVKPDTLSTPEQKLLQSLAPKSQIFAQELQDYAGEMKSKVKENFTVTPQMRNDFIARLKAKGVTVDSALLAQGGSTEIDRLLGVRITSMAFGDSATKRKYLDDDNQLQRALDALKGVQNTQGLFALVQKAQGVASVR
ncbi:MAG: S41 family peptidase [Gemmatimonadaceae bacterium]